MKCYVVFLVILIAASMGARRTHAQGQRIGDCPVVLVSCPDSDTGPTLTFTANTVGGDPSIKLTFNWTLSAGKITSGQGTPSISVDTSGFEGQTFTATVEVGGFDKACANQASCSTRVCGLIVATKFDEYGDSISPLPRTPKRLRRHRRRR
jgi:hypothetical protein